jgi:membrane protein
VATAARHPGRRQLLFGAFRELFDSFSRRDLLLYASAVSFKVLASIVPFLLFGLGLLGFLNLGSVWSTDVASQIKPHVSKAAFTVIDDTVTKVLTQKQVFWVTGGFALAIWEISGGMRASMDALNRIYEADEQRSWRRRLGVSILLALALAFLVLAALAVVWAGPLLYGDVGGVVAALLLLARWALAAALLTLAVGLTVRFAPHAPEQPAGWVSFGSALVVGSWIVASVLFGLYIRYAASYGSIFGSLATAWVLMSYVYLSAIVFFAGVQVDAIIRRRVEGSAKGS